MIVDLDQGLYVVDNDTQAHLVRFIDVKKKLIYVEDPFSEDSITITTKGNTETVNVRRFKYGTHDLTTMTKEINMSSEDINLAYYE